MIQHRLYHSYQLKLALPRVGDAAMGMNRRRLLALVALSACACVSGKVFAAEPGKQLEASSPEEQCASFPIYLRMFFIDALPCCARWS